MVVAEAASLYDISVGSYLQTFDALAGVLDKALAPVQEKNVDMDVIVTIRLFPDMWPLGFQVRHAVFHATASIAAIRSGTMSPFGPRAKLDYAGLQRLATETAAGFRAVDPEEINA